MKDTQLEITWTVLTAIIVTILAAISTQALMHIETIPENAKVIKVEASQWQWQFTYPNGTKALDELVLNKGEPVVFLLNARDVDHSFSIHELGVKIDVIPGHTTRTWTRPEKEGVYIVQCTEFCGLAHSRMRATVIVK